MESSDTGQPFTVIPLTKKELLKFFGYPDVNPSEAAFFFDNTSINPLFLLAGKTGTPTYGTLFSMENAGSHYIEGAHSKQSNASQILNSQLTGTAVSFARVTSRRGFMEFAVKSTFLGGGLVGGHDAILRGRCAFTFKLSKSTGSSASIR